MKRIEWIDVAKGIGIILVVMGHTSSITSDAARMIFSFHMPLFFFLSGFVFSASKYKTLLSFVKRKAVTLLIPYVTFSVLTYGFWAVIGRKFEGQDVSLWKPLLGIVYSNGIDNWLVHGITLWFLTCLFVVEVAFYLIFRNLSVKRVGFLLLVCSVIGYADSLYSGFRLPWSIDVAFTAIVFYGLGYIAKKLQWNPAAYGSAQALLILIAAAAGNIGFDMLNGSVPKVDMNKNQLGVYVYFYLSAICGIAAILVLSSLVARFGKMLTYLGRNTLVILAFHIITFKLMKAVLTYGFQVSAEQMEKSLVWSIGFTIASLLMLVPVNYFFTKYMPVMIGRPKKIGLNSQLQASASQV
ncbi:acyltransferase family protein [Paenibacillus gansuensis]|uniref:Acyltransferase family protein n=1 Tax=Paenibacillus gansuensis TaxID=306542 RepID=A0ABW5P787_9BACL